MRSSDAGPREAAGLERGEHPLAGLEQPGPQQRDLGRLADAVPALEDHEQPGHGWLTFPSESLRLRRACHFFLAGARRVVVVARRVVVRLGAGGLARFSASSSAARSTVIASTESLRRRVALVSPSVT